MSYDSNHTEQDFLEAAQFQPGACASSNACITRGLGRLVENEHAARNNLPTHVPAWILEPDSWPHVSAFHSHVWSRWRDWVTMLPADHWFREHWVAFDLLL
jgi:hypothetical protein